MSLKRQIRHAKKRGEIQTRKAAQDWEGRIGAIAEAGSKGSLLGQLGVNLGAVLLGGASAINPLLFALAMGAGTGAGKYFGGRKEAKALDKLTKRAGARRGMGRADIRNIAADIGGQAEDLKTSAVKSGLTSAASTFMLSGGSKYLKALKAQGKMPWSTGAGVEALAAGSEVLAAEKIAKLQAAGTLTPAKKAAILGKQYETGSLTDYWGNLIGAKTGTSALDKYLKKLINK